MLQAQSESSDIVNPKRRELLSMVLSFSATMAIANTGIYLIGTAFKELDGSLVAGAKACTPASRVNSCPIGFHNCGLGWVCDGSTGTWLDQRDCSIANTNPCP